MQNKQTTDSFFSVTDVHNKRVYDANGNDCGHVTSLLFDSQDAKLLFAIIRLEDDVKNNGSTAIPWNSIDLVPTTGNVALKMNKNLLLGAPKIDKSDFKLSNRNAYFDLLKYYGHSSNKLNPNSPTTQDIRENYHQQFEGEEFSGSPLDDQYRNNMGEELDFEKIKGKKVND
jgi:sporulation protein YlmC with PRC-barrel domain